MTFRWFRSYTPMLMVTGKKGRIVRVYMLHFSGGPITKLDLVWYFPWWFVVSGIIRQRRFRWSR